MGDEILTYCGRVRLYLHVNDGYPTVGPPHDPRRDRLVLNASKSHGSELFRALAKHLGPPIGQFAQYMYKVRAPHCGVYLASTKAAAWQRGWYDAYAEHQTRLNSMQPGA